MRGTEVTIDVLKVPNLVFNDKPILTQPNVFAYFY